MRRSSRWPIHESHIFLVVALVLVGYASALDHLGSKIISNDSCTSSSGFHACSVACAATHAGIYPCAICRNVEEAHAPCAAPYSKQSVQPSCTTNSRCTLSGGRRWSHGGVVNTEVGGRMDFMEYHFWISNSAVAPCAHILEL